MNKTSESYGELEKQLGYTFQDRGILTEALTHSSYSNEIKARGSEVECNERLEFLGDSVLSLAVTGYLFEKYKEFQEGDLTKIRASVVCEKALAKYAAKIGLGDHILLGHGEDMNRGRERASILSDAFEAVLAAMYLDSGEDMEVIKKFVLPLAIAEIGDGRAEKFVDYKTALQQIVQQVGTEKLEYVLVGEHGPDHDKTFEVEARLNSNVIGKGKARSKREAEQQAACEALSLFGENE